MVSPRPRARAPGGGEDVSSGAVYRFRGDSLQISRRPPLPLRLEPEEPGGTAHICRHDGSRSGSRSAAGPAEIVDAAARKPARNSCRWPTLASAASMESAAAQFSFPRTILFGCSSCVREFGLGVDFRLQDSLLALPGPTILPSVPSDGP